MQFGPYSFEASNLEKVLFPDKGITKGDMIDYYIKVADTMLPYLKDRPLAMHRFPDGIKGKDFFQKDVPDYFPEWIETARVKREKGSIDMVLANNAATLAYLANQACIAPHIFLSRAADLRKPDKMIFDLDPPEGRFELAWEAALRLREELEERRGLAAFVMTTGSEGLHVVVPLKADLDFDKVRDYARDLCDSLAKKFPDEMTTEIRKDKRKGRLFLDYLRNSYGQHSIAPYGLRALPGAPVATPLAWEELDGLKKGARSFNLSNLFQRLENRGDPWKGMGRRAQALGA